MAFGGSDGFFCGFAFGEAPVDVVGGFTAGLELGDDDGVECPVGLTVAAPVEPTALASSDQVGLL